MPLPDILAYREAVQNPQLCFTDIDLSKGQLELDAHRMPRPRSGNFGCVYCVHTGKGSSTPPKTWAIKLFTKEIPDLRERYLAINQYLKQHPISYFIECKYKPDGIRVNGNYYPILRMEWIQGDLLGEYIRNCLRNPEALKKLADRWLIMAKQLKQVQIAHGDLQDGNILVVNGALKLVDYDGMFVPGLANKPSTENGLPSYQHPRRGPSLYRPKLDYFSLWIIYLSLIALSVNPGIWHEVDGGKDCLILRKEDFENPSQSKVFKKLSNTTDSLVRNLTRHLLSFLDMDPIRVPSLDPTLQPPTVHLPPPPTIQGHPVISRGTTLNTYKKHSGIVKALAWSPNGKRIASASTDGTVQVWDAENGGNVVTYHGHSGSVNTVAWSPDGRLIASGGDDQNVDIWDATRGTYIATFRGDTTMSSLRVENSGGLRLRFDDVGKSNKVFPVNTVAWSPDGKYIAAGGNDQVVYIWEVATKRKTVTFTEHSGLMGVGHVCSVAWSRDGRLIASGGHDKVAFVWNPMNGDTIQKYLGHWTFMSMTWVRAVAWSPDGQRIASASDDRTVHVWKATTGEMLFTKSYTGYVFSVTWSPDGKRIASACDDNIADVFDATNGTSIYTYKGHTGSVNTIAWSPTGKLIATGSTDKTVQVWQAP